MGSLERVISRIGHLERNLSATTFVSAEQGHTELLNDFSVGGTYVWVVDKPAVYTPNEKKRSIARAKLVEIFNSDKWLYARYRSGKVISEPSQDARTIEWIGQLKKEATQKSESKKAFRELEKFCLHDEFNSSKIPDFVKAAYHNPLFRTARNRAEGALRTYFNKKVFRYNKYEGGDVSALVTGSITLIGSFMAGLDGFSIPIGAGGAYLGFRVGRFLTNHKRRNREFKAYLESPPTGN